MPKKIFRAGKTALYKAPGCINNLVKFNDLVFLIEAVRNNTAADLEKQQPNASELFPSAVTGSSVVFDPDSFDTSLGDTVTFGFVNDKGYVSKKPNVSHETMAMNKNFTTSGRAGYTELQDVVVPVIAFWNSYNDVKPVLAKAFKLVKQVNAKFPNAGPGVIVATKDRVGWFGNIDKVSGSQDRSREMDIRRKLHTETDPRRRRIYMQMLGMLPQY